MNRTFEDVLVEQCAPTLAGIKPASLFRFQADSMDTTRKGYPKCWNSFPNGFAWSRNTPMKLESFWDIHFRMS